MPGRLHFFVTQPAVERSLSHGDWKAVFFWCIIGAAKKKYLQKALQIIDILIAEEERDAFIRKMCDDLRRKAE